MSGTGESWFICVLWKIAALQSFYGLQGVANYKWSVKSSVVDSWYEKTLDTFCV
jgi:hypothetical protein